MSSVEPRGALATLIDDVIDRNGGREQGWSDRRIVRDAQARGYRLTASDVSLYRQQGMKTLVPAKVIAVAAGLHVPPYRVALAVLSDLGIDVPLEARTPEAAIHHDPTLSVRAKDWLLSILQKERAEALNGNGEPVG